MKGVDTNKMLKELVDDLKSKSDVEFIKDLTNKDISIKFNIRYTEKFIQENPELDSFNHYLDNEYTLIRVKDDRFILVWEDDEQEYTCIEYSLEDISGYLKTDIWEIIKQ